ncbi:4-hydroxy-3-methylbut-2-enyl diphosphate reductase [Bifidobacterium margollesii]|uniref:4-hydroxy-3-methylbut-2-enyl diphosphate reductase n=1 Tax=Bifidobacterium margollesii TaxID=2020964 RepID=A0A2N5JBU7_9BIFI|nr:4-hydroxy-3-methylbut-2-enyl diphosphate reductase [Bifidobacterium margollesii]PLS31678.1 4-hydroxy-3-methylbut-2-enyl diphosphate reductase [Bifidobacterium margollesii]
MGKSIVLADPRGFCAGVDRAIQTVETILRTARGRSAEDGLTGVADETAVPPVYVRRQIVHNRHVVGDLAAQGAVFVEELDEIPESAVKAGVPVVFSAHGVSPAVQEEARRRGMHVVDATCPLVSKVHREVLRYVKEGYEIVYIGHRGHDEAVGVVGEAPDHVHLIEHVDDVSSLDFTEDDRLVYLSQTTLSIDETRDVIEALKTRFPWIIEPPSSDICYATQNRQTAVKSVAEKSDCVVVVGSANSSNSVRLMEVAEQALDGRGHAHRVDDATELDPRWFDGVEAVGVTSGASVPEDLVSGVVKALEALGYDDVSYVTTTKEKMHFVLPAELRSAARKQDRHR